MALSITSKAEGASVTLQLEGRFGALEIKEFDRVFQEAVEGKTEALLDFSRVEYISSAGLRSLFLAKKLMTKQGGDLKVLYPTHEVMEVFKATGYDNIVNVVQQNQAPVFYPLRPVQRMMVDTHFQKAESTIMNAGGLARLDDSVDMERMAEAVNDVITSYDIFKTRFVFHPETGDICQRFDGEVEKIYVESLSDEAFEQRKQELRESFEIINQPLYRMYLIQTPAAKYFYCEFYHAIMDGAAVAMLFVREIEKRYVRGIEPKETARKPASYADYILEESRTPAAELEAGRSYWRKMLEGFSEKIHLPPQDGGNPADGQEHEVEVPMPFIDKAYFKDKEWNENTFFMGAAMLAITSLTKAKEAIITWVHNGRMTSSERRLMGLMLEQFPIRWDFDKDISVDEFLRGLEARTLEGMKYRKGMDVVYGNGLEDRCACFILQKGTMGRRGSFKLGGAEATIVEMPANEISMAENVLDIEMNAHDDGTFSLVLSYETECYSRASMEAFAHRMERIIQAMQEGGHTVFELLKL